MRFLEKILVMHLDEEKKLVLCSYIFLKISWDFMEIFHLWKIYFETKLLRITLGTPRSIHFPSPTSEKKINKMNHMIFKYFSTLHKYDSLGIVNEMCLMSNYI